MTIPSTPHPAVLAFTQSLQNDLSKSSSDRKPKCSKKLSRVSQTLGWRNRYSQSSLYPVELDVGGKRKCKVDDDGGTTAESKSNLIQFQIQQVQRGEVENTYGTGATVWPASMVLLKYLEHLCARKGHFFNESRSRRVTIADLGTGTGVTSIAAAFLLQAYGEGGLIFCTDGIDCVVDLALENIKRVAKDDEVHFKQPDCQLDASKHIMLQNSEIRARKYLWGDGTILEELQTVSENYSSEKVCFDVILVSDCLLPKLYPIDPLIDAINELSGPETVTYLTYEARYVTINITPNKFFRKRCIILTSLSDFSQSMTPRNIS
jgi:hypothetical protein